MFELNVVKMCAQYYNFTYDNNSYFNMTLISTKMCGLLNNKVKRECGESHLSWMGRKEDFRVGVGGESDLTPFSCSKKMENKLPLTKKMQRHARQFTEELDQAETRPSEFHLPCTR